MISDNKNNLMSTKDKQVSYGERSGNFYYCRYGVRNRSHGLLYMRIPGITQGFQ